MSTAATAQLADRPMLHALAKCWWLLLLRGIAAIVGRDAVAAQVDVLARAAEDAVAAWYCAFDPATPLKVKGTLLGALAYFILPFDVVPDFILGLGFSDDLAVLMTAMTLVKTHITQAHRDKAAAVLAQARSGVTAGVQPNGSQ